MVLSGRKDRSVCLPDDVRWLGYLPDEDIPVLLNAMDVFAVISRTSAFGRFSYPVKLYEAMACRIPVAATATEPAVWILKNQDAFLARPGDPFDLGRKLEHQLILGRMNYGELNTWEKSADKFETALLADG
jgi:glycosyltransferase involved in cell wall biosynthesis